MPQNSMEQLVTEYRKQLEGATAMDILKFFLEKYQDRIAFASSLGAEDQVITQMMATIDKNCKVFTLDTGRMFPETYDLIDLTNKRYGITIDIFFPDARRVETMVKAKGINLFYESIENRKLCCHIRKIEPLNRALAEMDVWISGLRRDQSVTRHDVDVIEWDALHNKIKINPILDWSVEEVWDYIHAKNIPYNPLHDKGFPSIGCQPCTRAIEAGEDIRAGRWWWENPEMKECGLHKA